MNELLLILLSTILVNNFVMAQFLGLCPFMGVSNNLESTIGMAIATSFVLTISSVCGYLLFHYVLVPLNLEFIKTISFILVIAVVVQITEIVIKSVNPVLYKILGVFLPLITTNCAVLGVALLNTKNTSNSLVESATFGLGSAIGFSLVLILFAAIRERLANDNIPTAFRGAAISVITAGLMSLAFMGFSGLVKW
jgi:electron transport complex protein RnfA